MRTILKTRQTAGFTMVELIMSTVILLSLLGFGTASYINFNERQIVDQAAKTLKTNIRVAQQNAVAGVKDQSWCNDRPNMQLTGWCMSAKNDRQYSIYGVCDDDDADAVAPAFFPQPDPTTFEIPRGVTIDTRVVMDGSPPSYVDPSTIPLENTRLRFNTFGTDVRLMQDTYTKVTYCITGSFPSLGITNKYSISIKRSGELVDGGFMQNCFTNAQAAI